MGMLGMRKGCARKVGWIAGISMLAPLSTLSTLYALVAPAAAQEFGLSGTVSNKVDMKGLLGVKVELVLAKASVTTDSLGAYKIGNASGMFSGHASRRPALDLSIRGNILSIRSTGISSFTLSLFDPRGRVIIPAWTGAAIASGVSMALPASLSRSGRSLLRLVTRDGESLFQLVPDEGSWILAPLGTQRSGSVHGDVMAKVAAPLAAAAVIDTLRVTRTGYKTVDLPIDARTGVNNFVLEAESFGCSAGSGSICWDFEEGRIPDGWTAYRNEFAGTLLVDGSKPHKGGFALHAKDLLGGAVGAQGGPKKSLKFTLPANFGPVLWGRAFVFTTPARPESHAGLFNARYPRPGAPATAAVNTLDWYELATYQQRYMGVWHPPEPPGFPEWVLQSEKPLVLDNWACLEWVFDAANGTAPEAADPRVWVDGAELSWPTRFVFSDPAGKPKPVQEKAQNFTFLETGVYMYQGLPVATNWWIDDLAVSPRRVGCN
jgi:hypothetical protein